ncbi:MAG: translation initiation factor IF-1 [Christensenellaceae bacterium]|nr:translation initiation factor IF-1 [Christensenellaceae bacterium]
MSKEDNIEVEGKVIEVMRNAQFKVQLANNHIVIAYLSGKLYKNNIKVLEGDSVKLELSPYDLTAGRITWRTK